MYAMEDLAGLFERGFVDQRTTTASPGNPDMWIGTRADFEPGQFIGDGT